MQHTDPALVDYLRALTTVPGGTFLHVGAGYAWDAHADASVHAILLTTDEPAALEQAYRVLRPGGHLLLLAEQGIGHQGACAAEDIGFEVRDCLLLADAPDDRLHYVPKASRAERDAGLGSTGKERQNRHPTVKPVKLMERLLANQPRDQGPVCDPFLGSGTTGVAAAATGHPFLGIEREQDYLAIAEARIAHAHGETRRVP